MKATVTTKSFLAVLTDLAATAGVASLACVHLRTRIGYWRDEPGQTTLLTGVSTSGMVGGHTWCLAQGTLEPTVWSLDDVKAVRAVFASAVKLHGADHTIDIEVTSDRQVTIRETPALFDAGTELSFTGGDPAQYPYAAVAKALDDTEQTVVKRLGVVVPDSRLTSWGGAAMRALLTVEKRRGDNLKLWRLHSEGRHLAQIGEEWRGFIFASAVDEPTDLPTTDLNLEHSEDSDEAVADWSAALMKGLGIKPVPEPENNEDTDDEQAEQGVIDDPDMEDLVAAIHAVITAQSGSAQMLQHKLGIGFAKAERLLEQMESHGIVSVREGPKIRDVLKSAEELPFVIAEITGHRPRDVEDDSE